MRYRKKPVVIEAVEFNSKSHVSVKEAREFVGSNLVNYQEHYASDIRIWYIKTLEGEMRVTDGDYIIKGIQWEFYPCKPDIFEATYEEV